MAGEIDEKPGVHVSGPAGGMWWRAVTGPVGAAAAR